MEGMEEMALRVLVMEEMGVMEVMVLMAEMEGREEMVVLALLAVAMGGTVATGDRDEKNHFV
jgi:hypothetical protein